MAGSIPGRSLSPWELLPSCGLRGSGEGGGLGNPLPSECCVMLELYCLFLVASVQSFLQGRGKWRLSSPGPGPISKPLSQFPRGPQVTSLHELACKVKSLSREAILPCECHRL